MRVFYPEFEKQEVIQAIREKLADLDEMPPLRLVVLFGSYAKGNYTAASDVDLLVEFREPDEEPARRFFGLLHQLEDILGCEVDLLTVNGLRNPYFRQRVLEERVPIYEG